MDAVFHHGGNCRLGYNIVPYTEHVLFGQGQSEKENQPGLRHILGNERKDPRRFCSQQRYGGDSGRKYGYTQAECDGLQFLILPHADIEKRVNDLFDHQRSVVVYGNG